MTYISPSSPLGSSEDIHRFIEWTTQTPPHSTPETDYRTPQQYSPDTMTPVEEKRGWLKRDRPESPDKSSVKRRLF